MLDHFLTLGGMHAIGTGVGSWGSDWVRKGLPNPFGLSHPVRLVMHDNSVRGGPSLAAAP